MSTKTIYTGPGILGWLTLIFLTLKLTGFISWSWWWVLSPTLIPLSLIVILLIIIGLVHLSDIK